MLNNTEKRIINLIRENPTISRIEIVERLKLSKPVVSVNIKRLIELGFVRETDESVASRKFGRKRIGLSFVPDCMYIVGIDIGAAKIEAIIGDLDGNIVKSKKLSTEGIKTKGRLIESIQSIIYELIRGFKKKIVGIGVGVPGTVGPTGGIVKDMPAFGLKDIDLKNPLEKEFRLPVFVENDVTLDAYAEGRIGAGRGYKNLFLLSLGKGIGGGIIVEGEIYRGSTGDAGEVGRIFTDWENDKNLINPSFGVLEGWFSGISLEKKLLTIGINTPKEGFALMEKDKRVEKIIKDGIYHTGIALANVIFILNPEVIIIKGGIGYNQYEKIMKYMTPIIEEIVPSEILKDVTFKRGMFKEFGVAIGAIFLAQKEILEI